jgi:hypothetical protein
VSYNQWSGLSQNPIDLTIGRFYGVHWKNKKGITRTFNGGINGRKHTLFELVFENPTSYQKRNYPKKEGKCYLPKAQLG